MSLETRPSNGISIGETRAVQAVQNVADSITAAPTVPAPGGVRGRIVDYSERAIDAVAGAAGRGGDPRVGKAKDFVRTQPLAVATLAGVLGLALIGTLRGRGRA